MRLIPIAERLWLEPTPLGVTLNFYEETQRLHYRVGISFESLRHCESALSESRVLWALGDRSLLVFGDGTELNLAFSKSTVAPARVFTALTGQELRIFLHAIKHFSAVASARLN